MSSATETEKPKAAVEAVETPAAPRTALQAAKDAFDNPMGDDPNGDPTEDDDDSGVGDPPEDEDDPIGDTTNEDDAITDDDTPAAAGDESGEAGGAEAKAGKPLVWSADLLGRAADAGFTADDAKNFGKPENLEKALDAFDRNVAALGRKPAEPAAAVKPAAAKTEPATKFELKLDDKMFDPELIKGVNEMNDHYNAQLESLQTKLTKFEQYVDAQNAAALQERMDGRYAELGKEWEDLMGKGPTSEMEAKSGPSKNRQKVQDEMEALAAGYAQLGKTVPKERVLFDKALRSVFGDQVASVERKKISDQLRTRKGRFTNRPTQRVTPPAGSPRERAVRAVEEKYKTFTTGTEDPSFNGEHDGE